MRKNIVFLDRSTFPSNIIFPKLDFNHKWKNHSFTKVREVKKRIEKAHIVVTNKIELNRNNLSNANTFLFCQSFLSISFSRPLIFLESASMRVKTCSATEIEA